MIEETDIQRSNRKEAERILHSLYPAHPEHWRQAAADRIAETYGSREGSYPTPETDSDFEALFKAWEYSNPSRERDVLAHWIAYYISWYRPNTAKMELR